MGFFSPADTNSHRRAQGWQSAYSFLAYQHKPLTFKHGKLKSKQTRSHQHFLIAAWKLPIDSCPALRTPRGCQHLYLSDAGMGPVPLVAGAHVSPLMGLVSDSPLGCRVGLLGMLVSGFELRHPLTELPGRTRSPTEGSSWTSEPP